MGEVSIHAFRGEGDGELAGWLAAVGIVSIHAFRGEGDLVKRQFWGNFDVSIHAFRGEGDLVLR